MTATSDSQENPKKLISDLTFCVFDLETTGGNHKSDKIIEIGLVRVENLEITAKKNYLIRPEIKIPEFIQKLTSIEISDVEHAPVIEDVIDDILDFMGDAVLVAHNTSFDIPFFNSVLKRLNKPILENKSICTNLMTKYLIPNLMNSNLNYMSKIYNIPHKKAHRALDDAMATAELLMKYLNIFIDKNIAKVNHLYYPKNRYELDRINYKKQTDYSELTKRIQKLKTPFMITLKGTKGVILFTLPCNNSKNEKNLITEMMGELDWKTATVRLFGSFIEAFVNFNNYFVILDNKTRSDIIKFLWQEHLPTKKSKPTSNEKFSQDTFREEIVNDFIVTTHLVPEQFVIFPILSLHPKSGLIFRYPSHKKKLLQYITSKSMRLKNNTLRKQNWQPAIQEFLSSYLQKCESDKGIYLFKKHLPLKKQDEFYNIVDQFVTKSSVEFNFPKDYI